VVDDSLYLAVLLEVADGNARETAVYFEALDEDALGDEAEGGDLLDDTVEGRLVEGDCVLCLVLDLSLGPLLFLCGLAATRRGGCFSFGLGEKKKKKTVRNDIQMLTRQSSASSPIPAQRRCKEDARA
jgi:hypothetical protein